MPLGERPGVGKRKLENHLGASSTGLTDAGCTSVAARQPTVRQGGFRSLLEVKWLGIEQGLNVVWEKEE